MNCEYEHDIGRHDTHDSTHINTLLVVIKLFERM